MKRNILFVIGLLTIGTIISACNNGDNELSTDEGNKKETTQNLNFEIDFDDFNTEEEADNTRASRMSEDTLTQEIVDLGNGILADVTMHRDYTAQTERRTFTKPTRAIPNETYTMYVYQGNTLKGSIKGNVAGGVFNPTSANKVVSLSPGTYNFVLFNSKVNYVANNLEVPIANALTAMVGYTTQTITATPQQQKVKFRMKHVGAAVRIQLIADMPIAAGTKGYLSQVSGTTTPNIARQNPMTKTAWGAKSNANYAGWACEFPKSAQGPFSVASYNSTSTSTAGFLPTTIMKNFEFKFTAGKIFNTNMANAKIRLNPTPAITTNPNARYLIRIRLRPDFIYLMSDGSTGGFKQTRQGGGSKTAIGVVLSTSKKMAIALKDAPHTNYWRQWDAWANTGATEQSYSWYLNNYDGWNYTWNPAYTKNRPNGTAARPRADFDQYATYAIPTMGHSCYYAAGYFNPDVTLTGKMTGGKKFYLPTIGEWKYMASMFNYTPVSGAPTSCLVYRPLVDRAFTQVGGTVPNGDYYSSTEVGTWSFPATATYNISFKPKNAAAHELKFVNMGQNVSGVFVRPFIKYP